MELLMAWLKHAGPLHWRKLPSRSSHCWSAMTQIRVVRGCWILKFEW